MCSGIGPAVPSSTSTVADPSFPSIASFHPDTQLWQTLWTHSPLGLLQMTPQGDCVASNRRWLQISGLSEAASLGEGWLQAIHPDDREAVWRGWSRCLREGQDFATEFRLLTPQQAVRWLRSRFVRLCSAENELLGYVGMHEDLTEQRQVETALRQSEQKLLLHLQQPLLGVIEWNLQFEVVDWNPAAEVIFGYRKQEALGRPASELVIPRQAQLHVEQIWHDLLAKRVGICTTHENVTRDGRVIICEWYNTPLIDQQGRVIGVASLVRDITERQQTEAKIRTLTAELEQRVLERTAQLEAVNQQRDDLLAREQLARTIAEIAERRYRSLADAMPLIVWTARPDGSVDFFNQRWVDYTGQTMAETLDWGWAPVVHPDDQTHCFESWHRAVQSGDRYEIEYRLRRADGVYRWYLGQALPLRDAQGQMVAWVGTCTDIDDQKRQQENEHFLSEVSRELAHSLDESTIAKIAQLAVPRLADWCAINLLEPDDQIRLLAVAHIDPTKVQLAQVLNERYPERLNHLEGVPKVLRTGQAEIIPEIPDSLLEALSHDTEHWQILRQLGLKSSMTVPMIAHGRILGAITFVTAESGRFYNPSDLGFAENLAQRAALALDNIRLFKAVQQELTDRQRTEQALRESEEDLRRRADELALLNRMLTQTSTVLETRNRELDQFAYVISHDLKAPMRAIANLSQWLEEDLADKLTEDTHHQMNLLRGRVHRMESLIDGLLQYSRVGRVASQLGTVSVETLLHSIVDLLAPSPGFELVLPPNLPTFKTETLRLEQVFANLISNAIKHSGCADCRVEVMVQDRGTAYEFAVKDNGPGIDPQYHDRIFVIFQTLEARDKVESTGIGLSLVKKIVEGQGGRVWVESRLGEGATFRFTWMKKPKD